MVRSSALPVIAASQPIRAVIVIAAAFGFIVVITVARVVSIRSARRRMEESAIRLRQQGYSVVTAIPKGPAFPFEEFRRTRASVPLHITQPGTYDTAFHYQYVVGSGDNKKTLLFTCAVVPVPFSSPGLSIWRGSRSILGAVMGNRVETDSESFNSVYEVKCNDERFAYTMLSYEVIDWFLSDPGYSSGVTVRVNQNWMLLVRDRVDDDEIPGMLRLAQLLRDRFPGVLTSLYPVPQ